MSYTPRFGPLARTVTFVALVVAQLLAPAPGAGSGEATATTGVATSETGWLPVDFVKHPQNPVHTFGPEPGQTKITDRVFPTVMRVDDKIDDALGRWYLWVWRHGLYPRTADNGGRLVLLTADDLAGPWVDRGFVTPENMAPEGWGPYSWTGGDVVWSSRHGKFFSTPHAYRTGRPGLDTFLMESDDGVQWRLSDVPQPVLPAGPETYDAKETGYGKLILERGPGRSERWTWLYRSGAFCSTCPNNQEHYTFAVATAGDVYGPWAKASFNPVFDPYAGHPTGGEGGLIGIDAFERYQGHYQLLWQDSFGEVFLSRSADLRSWEDFVPGGSGNVRPMGPHHSGPVFAGGLPHEVVIVGGDLVYDDTAAALTFLYLAWDEAQLTGAGSVSVNIARSATGGAPFDD